MRVHFLFVSLALLSPALPAAANVNLAPQGEPGRIESVARTALDGVVSIEAWDGRETPLGAGFLDAATGKLVTNAHVVGHRATIQVIWADGETTEGHVIARDKTHDIALIEPVGRPRIGLELSDHLPSLASPVLAIGAPFGEDFSLSLGIVSAQARRVTPRVPVEMIQHDAATNPGSSGGPLVDLDGRVVGMTTMIPDGFRRHIGIAYAIPAATIRQVADKMAAGEPTDGHRLEADLRHIDNQMAEALGLPQRMGALVDAVQDGGTAARAGLRPGDVIVTVRGNNVRDIFEISLNLALASPDDTLDIVVMRDGREVVLTLAAIESGMDDSGLGTAPEAQPHGIRASFDFADMGITVDENGRIVAVKKGNPASVAGLWPGEVVLAVNGEALEGKTLEELIGNDITGALVFLVETPVGGTRHVTVDPFSRTPRLQPQPGANVLDKALVTL